MLANALYPHDSEHSSELQEALSQYQIIFDNAIVGICFSSDRVILRCNSRFSEMFGYQAGELIGQKFTSLYPSSYDFERIGQNLYAHLMKHDTYSDERVMKRKNGDLFWCQVSGKTLDTHDPMRRAVWILQDVSERRRAEKALQRAHERLEQRVQERTAELRAANDALRAEMAIRRKTEEDLLASREKYKVLFETFPIGISITDDRGQVIEINKALARISSRSSLKILMQDLSTPKASLIHSNGSEVAKEELPSVRAMKEKRVVADVELGVRYSNSRIRWFNVTAAPIPVKGYGAVIAHAETTERKHREEQDRMVRRQLAHLSRVNMVGEMAAALAHELGQPLASILNYLHGCKFRLEREEFEPRLFRTAVLRAIRHAEQAGAIVNHVRQFVRRNEPEAVPTALDPLIEEMISFLEFERRQYEVAIRHIPASDLPLLLVDPLEIKQVILNLLKNGIEAMAQTPQPQRVLDISAACVNQRWVEIQIADRGPGVSKKDLAQMFNPFFTTKASGLGLGLAICRSIVESHGGRLCAAQNLDGGTTFRFTLPIVKPAAKV